MHSQTSTVLLAFGALLSAANAAQSEWDQCGGMTWTGGTTCASGLTCVVQNPYYSQCLASSGSSPAQSSPAARSSGQCKAKPTSSSTPSSPAPPVANAAQPEWAQCGGSSWTGGTTCASGLTCVVQNPYYSQCLASSGSNPAPSSPAPSKPAQSPPAAHISTTSSTTVPQQAASSAPPAKSSSPASSGSGSGPTYKASFTHYGAGDSFGSPNCQTSTAACGWYTSPGFSAAASQNLFGVGPGAGAGPACGTCWKLVGETDSSGNALTNAGTSIVVMVNNLCPAQGNPLCSQSTLTDTNQYGANVNFDLCSDSGAQAAFFGNDGVGLAVGTATQVDCSEWNGSVVH